MDSSVIVTTYGRPTDLIECIDSLLSQFTEPDEIVVVDDGDIKRTEQELADSGLAKQVKHVAGPRKNLPAARNRGLEVSSGEIVCFIDDDVVLPPLWLEELLSVYEREEDVAGVGGYVLNYNPKGINKANIDSFGYRALTGFRQLFLQDRIGDISPLGILWAPHIFQRTSEVEVDALQGCNMSFRRSAIGETRFDEWFGQTGSSACEEIDFCDRVGTVDHRLVYNPRAVAIHKRSSNGTSRTEGPNYSNISNLAYFILKSENLSYHNFVLFAIAISVYSLFRRDSGYLAGIKTGCKEYWRHRTRGTPTGDRDE